MISSLMYKLCSNFVPVIHNAIKLRFKVNYNKCLNLPNKQTNNNSHCFFPNRCRRRIAKFLVSNFESIRALKLYRFEIFRAFKLSNLAMKMLEF